MMKVRSFFVIAMTVLFCFPAENTEECQPLSYRKPAPHSKEKTP